MKVNSQHIALRFYTAFQQMNAELMISCYHSEAEFHDPAFGTLIGKDIGYMWRMLLQSQKGKEFTIHFTPENLEESSAIVHWEAFYIFSKTSKIVHNKITARLEIRDGLIVNHVDTFNLYTWSKQALGITGWLIGWTPYFRAKIKSQTGKLLNAWKHKNGF